MRQRIQWVDTAKFLGIFAIYLGHFAEASGNALDFVFSYHIPLFFFLSGCMSTYDRTPSFLPFARKKVRTILVPSFFFSLLSLVTAILQYRLPSRNILRYLKIMLEGNIRNQFLAGSLWFLTCLFVMELLFKLLTLALPRRKLAILLICLAACILSETVIHPPKYLYNLDSALSYLVYYGAGFAAYPVILSLLRLDTSRKRWFAGLSGLLTFVYAACLYQKIDPFGFLYENPWTSMGYTILKALVLIWLNLVIAKLLEQNTLLNALGRNSLYLCGNEYIIQTIMTAALSMLGLELAFPTPFTCYLYIAFLFLLCLKWLIPAEKWLLKAITEKRYL